MTYNLPATRRVAAILAGRRTGEPCGACGIAHAGGAWSPAVGWHDAPDGRTVAELFPDRPAILAGAAVAEPAPHDPDAVAGADCAGCGPVDYAAPMRRYVITAARAAGADACGHWHAEHATDSAEDMERLAAELGERHAEVTVLRWADSVGRFEPYRAVNRGDRASSAPCCRPVDEPDRGDWRTLRNPHGARCLFCGDLMARWTH